MKKVNQIVVLWMVLATVFCTHASWGQDLGLGFGFKVGLNSSTFYGEIETDSEGNETEEFTSVTGFHVGAMGRFQFSKWISVRSEFLFSQKGGRYLFEGEAFQDFSRTNGTTLHSYGNGRLLLRTTNSYLDIPVLVAFHPTSKLRIGAGASAGVLVRSRATGEWKYSGTLTNGSAVKEYLVFLEYDNFKDEAGTAPTDATIAVDAGTTQILLPETLGAYYYEIQKDGNYFHTFEIAALAEVVYRLNGGLEFGVRVSRSLTDITNNYYDYARTKNTNAPDYARIPRADKDGNFNILFSIGFGF